MNVIAVPIMSVVAVWPILAIHLLVPTVEVKYIWSIYTLTLGTIYRVNIYGPELHHIRPDPPRLHIRSTDNNYGPAVIYQ